MSRGIARVFMFTALLAGGVAVPSTAREVPFAASQTIADVVDATRVRAVDVDRDGDLDLVGHSATTVYWYERDPGAGGGYVDHVAYQYPGATDILRLEAVDVDSDGDVDVLVYRQTDEVDNTLFLDWLSNDGTPAVGTWPRYNVKEWPDQADVNYQRATGLAAGDFDGDGDLDTAVGRFIGRAYGSDDGQVEWLESDGSPANGGWEGHELRGWVSDRFYSSLRANDVDSDGDLDLAGTYYPMYVGSRIVVYWENDGSPANGTWPQREVELDLNYSEECVDDLDLGDIDRDGDPDLLLADEDSVNWWENDGSPANGEWSRHQIPATAPSTCSVRLADLDRDGDLDVASDEPGVGWYENDGSPAAGTWDFRSIENIDCDEVQVADLDGDGDPDVAASDYQRFYWHENLEIHRSAKLLDENLVVGSVDEPFDLLSADVDGDGDTDLVSAASATDRIYLHRNDGTPGNGGWATNTVTDLADNVRGVAAGDLDRDGDLDLVSASYNDDAVAWYENDGTPGSGQWTRRLISTGAGGANDVVVADFDRDGDLDVACAQFLDDEISWYRNNGGAPPTFTPLFVDGLSFAGPRAVAVGDFDGNGFPDLASVSETGNGVAWYENDGTPADGEWVRSLIASVAGPKELAVADLDRDGDSDVVVAAYGEDQVRWYENDGTPSSWTARLVSPCGGARSVDATDFDLDSDRDVLFSCYDDDAIWLARSNGGSPPSFTEWPVSVTAGGVRSVAAADLDRDGDLDGAAVQGGDDEVAWYENRGGQFRVLADSIANDPLGGQPLEPVLDADVAHRGRSGDGLIEVSSFAVRFEEGAGDPLSAWQAAALMDAVQVYGDDGDSVFEPGVDPLLASAAPAGINAAGMVRINFADGLPEAAITALAEKTYFVVLDIASPIGDLAPDTLRVTLLTDGDAVCEAEDREHDIPLLLEHANNFSTATVGIVDLPLLFSDGFESGDTSAWSATVP